MTRKTQVALTYAVLMQLLAAAGAGVGAQSAGVVGEHIYVLPTVVVEGTPLWEDEVKFSPQSRTVITQEEIERKQAKSVEEIIFHETGMTRNTDAMGRVTLSVRGAEPRHTLILVDGHPVMGDLAKYGGQADELMRLGTENVERIEIIRGAASARYGADAIGGVVNIITKEAAATPKLQLNWEGRRVADDESELPYKSYFLRADTGQVGKFRAAIYGSHRDVMPIYSETLFENGVNTKGPIRNAVRFFGDVQNVGVLATYQVSDAAEIDFAANRSDEVMKRLTKHSTDGPDPVVHFGRNAQRDTYRIGYSQQHGATNWKLDVGYAKMTEHDTTISSIDVFSPYQGKNKLRYLDHVLHKNWNVKLSGSTQLNERHLLTFGAGYMKEEGEGSRIKGAKTIRTRYIDPWDYDKNLHTDDNGVPESAVEDHPMQMNEKGVPQYDQVYDRYGYRDEYGKSHAPVYTFEDYEEDDPANEAKRQQFIAELRRDNPAEAFIEDDDPMDDETILRRYYGDYKRTLVWHGKKFEQEVTDRKNRQQIGRAEIEKQYVFLQDAIRLNDKTTVTPTLRWDHSNLFGSQVSAGLGMTHLIGGDENRRLKVNVGTGYTEPGIGELYYHWEMYAGMPYDLGIGRLGFYWFGNPNLKPEKSLNFDIGYEQEHNRNRFRLNVFHNRIRDYMTTYFTGALMDFHPGQGDDTWINPPDMIYSFKNIGKAEITGVETEFSRAINDHFSWKLGHTYLHAINRSDKNMPRQLLNKPQHKIDLGLTYENRHSGIRLSFWGDYYVNMLDGNTVANNGNFVYNETPGKTEYKFAKEGQQTYELKSFGRWNVFLQKQMKTGSLVYFGVDNVFNHRDDDQAIPERTYKFGVNWKFDDAGALFTECLPSLGLTTLSPQTPFIVSPFADLDGVRVFGDYRIRHAVMTGKQKPAQARVTTKATIGSAYKNYLERGESGFAQRIRIGAVAPLGARTNVTLVGALSGTAAVDTRHDVGDTALNKARLEQADVTHNVSKWDFSIGRLTEPMGVSGYWFGKEYDGVRAVWTEKKTQLRVGYGDFRHSTGVTDSAYSRAEHAVFMRTPTKKEWLGYDEALINDETYTVPHTAVPGFESLYDKLAKAKTLADEKRIIDKYFKVIAEDDPKAYEKIAGPSSYKSNSHIWRVVTATDKNGNVKKFLTTDTFDTYVPGKDPFDREALRKAGETSWNTVMSRTGENREQWKGFVSGSGVLSDQQYTFTSEFYGYGTYTGKEVLADLATTFGGKRYAGFELNQLQSGDFQRLSKEEAKERALASLYDKDYALEKVRKRRADGEKAIGYRKAQITPIAEKIINLAAEGGRWKPEGNSNLPLHLLAKKGYLFPQEGIVLKADNVPAIEQAVYLQLRQELTPAVGVNLWYLRSVNDDQAKLRGELGIRDESHQVGRLADVVGAGVRVRIGKYATLSADYGVNHTDFGAYMNGHTRYEHAVGTSDFVVKDREAGDTPSFHVIRFDVGRADTTVAGSWNAFVDYKSFDHGAFFGGNGTEALSDRYLDGIRSFTVGIRYVPVKHLLLEGFYTFGAEGIGTRDTLYGPEHFRLGNYTRVQATLRF